MDAVQEVIQRLERAMAQLGREMDGLPDCLITFSIKDGKLSIENVGADLATQPAPPIELPGKRSNKGSA
jgi:hypothetical protein